MAGKALFRAKGSIINSALLKQLQYSTDNSLAIESYINVEME